LIKDEDPFRQCTICLQPFELDNGKFKIEIIEKEFIQYHKIHESEFHKECIHKWMKDKNRCPICRKILKGKNVLLIFFTFNPEYTKNVLQISRRDPSSVKKKYNWRNLCFYSHLRASFKAFTKDDKINV
jgi:hypothetical protein